MKETRNPLIIPGRVDQSVRDGCPKCGHPTSTARSIAGGLVSYTCAKCSNEWFTGRPAVVDPNRPMPPQPRPPPVTPEWNSRTNEWTESRRPVSLVPDYRTGVPLDEDNDV